MEIARSIEPAFKIDDLNRQAISDVFDWCLMRKDSQYDPTKGLWLYGNIGTGKSTLLRIVKAFCSEVRPYRLSGDYYIPYSFRITKADEIARQFAIKGFPVIEDYIRNKYQAFDELGAESITNHYSNVQNVMEHILLGRYENRREDFTHVTTNYTLGQVAEQYGERVYDRCKEMFNFVKMEGESWRNQD